MSSQWCALHRVNKETSKDDVMCVFFFFFGINDYNLDAVHDY